MKKGCVNKDYMHIFGGNPIRKSIYDKQNGRA
jgi:hypothetical protein